MNATTCDLTFDEAEIQINKMLDEDTSRSAVASLLNKAASSRLITEAEADSMAEILTADRSNVRPVLQMLRLTCARQKRSVEAQAREQASSFIEAVKNNLRRIVTQEGVPWADGAVEAHLDAVERGTFFKVPALAAECGERGFRDLYEGTTRHPCPKSNTVYARMHLLVLAELSEDQLSGADADGQSRALAGIRQKAKGLFERCGDRVLVSTARFDVIHSESVLNSKPHYRIGVICAGVYPWQA